MAHQKALYRFAFFFSSHTRFTLSFIKKHEEEVEDDEKENAIYCPFTVKLWSLEYLARWREAVFHTHTATYLLPSVSVEWGVIYSGRITLFFLSRTVIKEKSFLSSPYEEFPFIAFVSVFFGWNKERRGRALFRWNKKEERKEKVENPLKYPWISFLKVTFGFI